MSGILNKGKVAFGVGAVLTVVKWFFPDAPVTPELTDAFVLVVMFFAFFFTKESRETLKRLILRN